MPDFVCNNQRVIVKFTGKECAKCEELAPAYLDLSEQEDYSGIRFLKLDAEDNPIASKEVSQHGTPFIAAYRNGDLIGQQLAASKADMIKMLNSLL
ncbi:thioredoxin family protein [Adhaeribacter sp. BT258]|uniref:Thioredoxin family protein n=1 Tax=Adhaeribacter terrigena TaxID=2793070 RepID=A0ABS1C4Z4_9BACT|nr:thioredoxin family protein [Adhaeribacter terrigena]